jgi:hypothetical protein
VFVPKHGSWPNLVENLVVEAGVGSAGRPNEICVQRPARTHVTIECPHVPSRMTHPNLPPAEGTPESETAGEASFAEILSQFERSHHAEDGTVRGTVVSVTPEPDTLAYPDPKEVAALAQV